LLPATSTATSDAFAVRKNFFIFRSKTENAGTDASAGRGTVKPTGALRRSGKATPRSTISMVQLPGASMGLNPPKHFGDPRLTGQQAAKASPRCEIR